MGETLNLDNLSDFGAYTEDLKLDKLYRRGNKGNKVILIQEWLGLHDIHVTIDGDFGPATDGAVKAFQHTMGLKVDGIVGEKTFREFINPMIGALGPIDGKNSSLGDLVVSYAEKHLKPHPREIGGPNNGPWVRLYLNGEQGLPWCAGFVSFLLKQAASILGKAVPIDTSFSCDYLARSAMNKNKFLEGDALSEKSIINPGSLFLLRKTENDWTHIGIVTEVETELFRTIEGNTNHEGSREGYEVCCRTRGYNSMDFIKI